MRAGANQDLAVLKQSRRVRVRATGGVAPFARIRPIGATGGKVSSSPTLLVFASHDFPFPFLELAGIFRPAGFFLETEMPAVRHGNKPALVPREWDLTRAYVEARENSFCFGKRSGGPEIPAFAAMKNTRHKRRPITLAPLNLKELADA